MCHKMCTRFCCDWLCYGYVIYLGGLVWPIYLLQCSFNVNEAITRLPRYRWINPEVYVCGRRQYVLFNIKILIVSKSVFHYHMDVVFAFVGNMMSKRFYYCFDHSFARTDEQNQYNLCTVHYVNVEMTNPDNLFGNKIRCYPMQKFPCKDARL